MCKGTRPYRHDASSSSLLEPTYSLGWTCARCTKGHRLIKITHPELWILVTLKEIYCPEIGTHLHFYSKKIWQGAPLSLCLTGTAWLAFRQLWLLPPIKTGWLLPVCLFLDAPWSLLTPELWKSIVWKLHEFRWAAVVPWTLLATQQYVLCSNIDMATGSLFTKAEVPQKCCPRYSNH